MSRYTIQQICVIFFAGASLLGCAGNQGMPTMAIEPPAIEAEAEYRLGSEDVVEILIWREPDLSKTVTVRPDGRISIPLVGDMPAAGLTSEELMENVAEALSEYVDTPTVSITVLETRSMKFFVQGEVAKPGPFLLNSPYTILQAISLAGGFTEWANTKKIVVIRRENGREITIPINYDKIVSGEDRSQNIVIKRGDTILVP